MPLFTRPAFLRVMPFLTLAACALETGSCAGSHGVGSQTGSVASHGVAVVGSASTTTSASSSVESHPPPPAFDPSSISALTAQPLLEMAGKYLAQKSYRAAADAIDAAISSAKLAPADLPRAWFLMGRCFALAKDDDAADKAYAAVVETSPLYVHASLRRAAIAAKKGKGDDALALLAKVPDAPPFTTDRAMALGEALASKGDHAGAATAFFPERKSARGVDASIRYAEEVAAQGSAGAPLALDAAQGARRVRFETPLSSLVARAEDAENACKALLPPTSAKLLGAPTPNEQITMAQAILDAGKPKDAEPIVVAALASIGAKGKGKEPWCRGELLLAKVHERVKEKGKASDDYGAVEAACTDEASRVIALYDGAKLANSAKKPELARARYAALEKSYPKHRLADDARLRGAQLAIDAGDLAKGEAMLVALPDDYPDGDMRTEALFRLALTRMKTGDWKGAIPFLQKSLSLAPHEDGYFVAGRAAYFLGRAEIETGQVEAGVARLRTMIVDEPLTFASAMAYARLSALSSAEASAAKLALEGAMAAEPAGALFSIDRPELSSEAFARAVELARVLETDLAKKELSVAGLLKDAAKDPDGQWIAATLLARVGDARSSHNIARAKVTDWQRHFPAGKWRAAWELSYPRPWASTVEESASRESVPSAVVWSVMREESAFDPDAVSPSNAYGLLQLIAPTAAAYAKSLKLPSDPKSLTQPDVNIPIGTAYLRKLRAEFSNNPALAIPSYNAGEGATRKWMSPPLADSFDLWSESIPYDETRKYTKRVLTSYFAYVAMYDVTHLDEELRAAAGK